MNKWKDLLDNVRHLLVVSFIKLKSCFSLSSGDTSTPFCLQSLARSISYGITLNELDADVHKFQGREPSGRKFEALVLDSNSNMIFITLLEILYFYVIVSKESEIFS